MFEYLCICVSDDKFNTRDLLFKHIPNHISTATTNANLRKVQDMFGERMGKDVFFYSVTLQPEQDTVPILKEYAEDIFEVGPGWLFLTGKQSDIDTLRHAQGFVDPDPERDRDVTLHSSTGRLIDDNNNRWAMVPLNTSANNVYTALAKL